MVTKGIIHCLLSDKFREDSEHHLDRTGRGITNRRPVSPEVFLRDFPSFSGFRIESDPADKPITFREDCINLVVLQFADTRSSEEVVQNIDHRFLLRIATGDPLVLGENLLDGRCHSHSCGVFWSILK